jgi:hypothetical protein
VVGGEADRGWSYLSADAQAGYRGDQALYVREMRSVNWETFHWADPEPFSKDGFWASFVRVDGRLSRVPGLFFKRPIASPSCVDHEGVGIYLPVQTSWLGPIGIGGGARTGTQERGECP